MENDRFVLVSINMVHCGGNCLTLLWPQLPRIGHPGLLPKTAHSLVAAAAHSNDRISFSTFQFCTSKPRIRLTVNKSSTCPIRICLQINFCPFSRSPLSTFILIYAERWECTKFLASPASVHRLRECMFALKPNTRNVERGMKPI